jgi:phosphatidylserine/phosphatidylglycerophosphate/cardiolipin synthase-like enzyme
MKKSFLCIIILLSLTSHICAEDDIDVYFSPRGQCTEAIVKEIEKAKTEILVQAYSFTSKDIVSALVMARQKGIHIEIILDKSNMTAKYSAADFTTHAGIVTYIDSNHAIAHNKVIIIDEKIVITGSFNFTKAAEEHNAENLIIIHSKELALKYCENWALHKGHSEVYMPK